MPKRVLLADDSTTIQRVVELAFAREDVIVNSVADGEQAVEAIRRSPPDLVLADIGMPGRSGYEVVEFVRSQPALASMPVLLLAGAFEPVDPQKAHAVGADGILTKPFDPAVLIGRVHELLTQGRGPVSFSASPAVALPSFRRDLREPVPPPQAAPEELPAGESRPATETDRYFAEVDEAFAALSSGRRPPLTPQREPLQEERGPAPVTARPASTPAASGVPLTDAFAALLEAERTGDTSLPVRLVQAAAPQPPAIDVDALAEQIARRVLEQLSERVVRETVADIVGAAAERLVREEIERIKRNIT